MFIYSSHHVAQWPHVNNDIYLKNLKNNTNTCLEYFGFSYIKARLSVPVESPWLRQLVLPRKGRETSPFSRGASADPSSSPFHPAKSPPNSSSQIVTLVKAPAQINVNLDDHPSQQHTCSPCSLIIPPSRPSRAPPIKNINLLLNPLFFPFWSQVQNCLKTNWTL